MVDFLTAKIKAEEVLAENYITKPPVPVVELVKNYGYDIQEVKLPPDVAGFLDPKNHIIYINISDSDTRKAFTIAHELGHIKLHASSLEHNPDIGILYRRPLGRKDDNPEEQEANSFAACLLVPESMLQEIKNQYKDITQGEDIELLSSLFGVSPEVMGYRLHDTDLEQKNGA